MDHSRRSCNCSAGPAASRSRAGRAPWPWTALAVLAALVAQAAAAPPADLRQRLRATLDTLPKATMAGLIVVEPGSGRVLFEHNADTPLKPASIMKLLVTAAALERLGPEFSFTTEVYASGGEVWIRGGGDPALGDGRVAERHGGTWSTVLDEWAAALRSRGLTTIERLVLDDSIFDREHRHPDWNPANAQHWYAAPVGGLNICTNCVEVSVRVARGAAAITTVPALPPGFVANAVRVGQRGTPIVRRAADSDLIEVRGTASRSGPLATVSIGRPAVFFGHVVKQALAERGILVTGDVVRRELTPAALASATPIAVTRTPLVDILWRCNNFSQNMFAECLTKALAAYDRGGRRTGRPGSWATGTAVVTEAVAALGVDLRGAVLRDGSGLSHHNRLTVRQVATLLERMERHRHAALFRESLARPDTDGTLRNMNEEKLRGRLAAKTGTLAGVRALAGHVRRRDGGTLTFALLVNGTSPADFPTRVAALLVD
jgi:D-alanyl-D-alanine carboxypeptidase/D-alanyl-D-alanine-endopeptidase (penicillin-binding protein 4)